ncbi:MAG: hypothetical protein J6Q99_00935, partial [Oscillospiraceae bacterium]|nr:hypothetical protein [Oscillospiraceae bacterium]
MKKAKERFKQFWKSLKLSLPVTLLMTLFWLVLGWLRSFGIHSIVLSPLNYLTGALVGLDGGSFVGGLVGKTIILIVVNNFVRSLITSRGNLWIRVKIGLMSVWSSLLRKIPQYLNIKQLFTKEHWRISVNGMGFGMALVGYALFSGNGSFQNSFVCLLLFAQFGGALVSKRGLIVTAANRLLSALGGRTIDRDMVNRLVGGNALGYFVATLWAAHFNRTGYAGHIGITIASVSLLFFVLHHLRNRKEAA